MANQNRHKVDRYAEVCSEIAGLEEEKRELRKWLLDNPDDLQGDDFIAKIIRWPQNRVDKKALLARFGREAIDDCSKKIIALCIKLRVRVKR